MECQNLCGFRFVKYSTLWVSCTYTSLFVSDCQREVHFLYVPYFTLLYSYDTSRAREPRPRLPLVLPVTLNLQPLERLVLTSCLVSTNL